MDGTLGALQADDDPLDAGESEPEEEVPELVEFARDDEDEYHRKMDQYLQHVAAGLPPAIPPPPIHANLAAETLQNSKVLLQRPPNLLKANFESAHRQCPGEQWLKERISSFDAGNRRRRKEVLEEFLEYVKQSSLFGLEELFSKEAHLFLVRLTSWFSVMLPLLYELPLQLKVFLVFLEFREAPIVRNFFESGTVVSLMRTLATDFDAPDEVRCLSVLVLQRLVLGRTHKEVLCSKGIISQLVECIQDGLKWETVKCAGNLLGELFRSNPKYQEDVMASLLQLLSSTALATRVSLAILSQLVDEDYAGSDWPSLLIPRMLVLLDGPDLRASADASCLVRSLVQRFRCDRMLWDFARQMDQPQDVDAWTQVEVAAVKPPPNGVPESLAQRLKQQAEAEIARLARSQAKDYGSECQAEARDVLKLSLQMFLVKRSQDLCNELVNNGLTECLLMRVLDLSRPMRQAAACPELQHLQLLSPHAKQIVEAVLVKRAFLRALTAEQLVAAGSAEDFARARQRLRAMQRQRAAGVAFGDKMRHSADEHELTQRILDHHMANTLDIRPSQTAFLTEPVEEEVEPDEGAPGSELENDDEPIKESTVLAALRDLISEPMTREAAAQSALLQEVEELCLSARRPPAPAPVAPHRQCQAPTAKASGSSHSSGSHRRALIMRRVVRRRPLAAAETAVPLEPAPSEASEAVSLVCVAEANDTDAMARSAQSAGWERVSTSSARPRKAEISMVDTSIGPEFSQEFSFEDISQEMSQSHQEMSVHDCSLMTAGTLSTHEESRASRSHMGSQMAGSQMATSHAVLPDIEEEALRPQVLQSAALVALVGLPRDQPGPTSFRKKLLCVAAPPYHNCVAFANSREDRPKLERLPTRQLMERIAEAGKFPRRWLRKHSAEVPHSARAAPQTPRLPPLASAREPRQSKWQDKLEGLPANPLSLVEFFPASRRSVDSCL